MDTEPASGEHLDDLFHRSKSARKRHERVGKVEHQLLALVHGVETTFSSEGSGGPPRALPAPSGSRP
jgi:hypothetical protein